MSEAAEYRALADECLGWAKSARSDRECRIFLQMAETWLEAAAIAERRGTRVCPMESADRRQDQTDTRNAKRP
jgi:hypothetical protein